MSKARFFGALAATFALATIAPRAAAQDVQIGLSWGGSGLRATAYYVSPGLRPVVPHVYYDRGPRRLARRHFAQCVAEGPYLYCWDAPRSYRVARPVVYVYATERAAGYREYRGKRGHGPKFVKHHRNHRAAAARAWRHWADDHRYRYDRDRFNVDVVLTW
ncbi:MAG TPA: hypothetical protein VGA02_13115 [Gemmatimonadales bacterium]